MHSAIAALRYRLMRGQDQRGNQNHQHNPAPNMISTRSQSRTQSLMDPAKQRPAEGRSSEDDATLKA